jgi:hypothetical protein
MDADDDHDCSDDSDMCDSTSSADDECVDEVDCSDRIREERFAGGRYTSSSSEDEIRLRWTRLRRCVDSALSFEERGCNKLIFGMRVFGLADRLSDANDVEGCGGGWRSEDMVGRTSVVEV